MRHQLVLGVSAVVTIVVLVVGVVSVVSLRTYVNAMNDAEVDESLDALDSFVRQPSRTANRAIATMPGTRLLGFTGQNAGNVIAVIHHGDVIGSAVFYEDDPRPATPDVVAAIKAQPWRDGQIRTVKLGSLGSYRVSSQMPAPMTNSSSGFRWTWRIKPSARRIVSATVLSIAALLVTAGLTALVVGLCAAPVTPGRRDRRRGRRHAAHRRRSSHHRQGATG